METVKRGILNLICSAVTGEACTLPEGFSMEEAYPLVRDGQVITLVYESALQNGIPGALPSMKELRQEYYRRLLRSEKQMQMLHKVCEAFAANGIDYMPLKGSVLKEFYRKPEQRVMGDADILIRMEQYEKIKALMEELGFREGPETDHELVWMSPDLYLELHKRIVPASNKDLYRYFGDGWKLAKPLSGTRHGLSEEDTFVYLFAHFAKHFRSGGIGCRHVVDLWVYHRAHPHMDEMRIARSLEKLQLTEFYENILRMLRVWFEGAQSDEKSEYLTDMFFKGTYFGTREEHMIASGAMNAKRMKSARLGKVVRIWKGLFPDRMYMTTKYPVLKKYPALLPVLWPWRWITGILFRRENLRRIHRELHLTDAKTVSDYQKQLEYVGLDFHVEE